MKIFFLSSEKISSYESLTLTWLLQERGERMDTDDDNVGRFLAYSMTHY